MTYEQKEGQGSLFKNDRKTNDRQPSYTGTAKWKGETIRISLWQKQSNGKVWLSLALSEPMSKQEQIIANSTGGAKLPPAEDRPPLDDEIPWSL
jgi:hypothetical protein